MSNKIWTTKQNKKMKRNYSDTLDNGWSVRFLFKFQRQIPCKQLDSKKFIFIAINSSNWIRPRVKSVQFDIKIEIAFRFFFCFSFSLFTQQCNYCKILLLARKPIKVELKHLARKQQKQHQHRHHNVISQNALWNRRRKGKKTNNEI